MTQATTQHHAQEAGTSDSCDEVTISLYGPAAVAIGAGASAAGAMFAALLALAAKAEGDSLMGGVVAAMLLAGSWIMAWGGAAITGPYRPAVAGMAWLAISTARLLVLVVAGIAFALAAPTMGLGLWLALLVGGLTAVGIDCAMALRSFRQQLPVSTTPTDSNDDAHRARTSGGSR